MKFIKDHGVLLALILAGAFLRFYRIDLQSLWLDELYTMREADPDVSWSETLEMVRNNEGHPPLFFLIERILFLVFGHTSVVARSLSAVAGIAGIVAMYLLGYSARSKKTGLAAAVITAFNPFLIYYSQDARVYSCLFLFTALSYVFLIRLMERRTLREAVWYVVCSLLMLNFHPFALLVLLAQFLFVLVCFAVSKPTSRFLIICCAAAGAIALGFLPMLVKILEMSKTTSGWIGMPRADFFVDYFYGYFLHSEFLKPFLLLAAILFFVDLLPGNEVAAGKLSKELIFILILSSLLCIFLVPYIRSVQSVPSLVERYTIIALPPLILMLSTGIGSSRNLVAAGLLSTYAILVWVELFPLQKKYKRIVKSQYRELLQRVRDAGEPDFPLVHSLSAWQMQYYLDLYKMPNRFDNKTKPQFIDSLLRLSPSQRPRGFWLLGVHGERLPEQKWLDTLAPVYELAGFADLVDAWGRLYVSRDSFRVDDCEQKVLFEPQTLVKLDSDSALALFGDAAANSRPMKLEPGNYRVSARAFGTPLAGEYPLIEMQINGVSIGQFNTASYFKRTGYSSYTKYDTLPVVMSLRMLNDANSKLEDRNAFIKRVCLERVAK